MVPLLSEDDLDFPPAFCTYRRWYGDISGHMVRTERYKFVHWTGGGNHLYDMVEDPGEYRNLSGLPEFKEIEDEHTQLLVEEGIIEPPPDWAARKPNPLSMGGKAMRISRRFAIWIDLAELEIFVASWFLTPEAQKKRQREQYVII